MAEHKILPIPDATVGELLGLVEIVYSYGGKLKISFIADELRMEMDDLGDVVDMGELLGVIKVKQGVITLTIFGEALSLGTIDNKKKIIRDQMKKVEPFKSIIAYMKKKKNNVSEKELLEGLGKKFVVEDQARFRKLLIGWGNYTETFEYDSDDGLFRLVNK